MGNFPLVAALAKGKLLEELLSPKWPWLENWNDLIIHEEYYKNS